MVTGNDLRAIRNLLGRVRWRERSLAGAWTLARSLAVITGVFLLACSADWLVDLWRDTPYPLRVTLLSVQVALWAGCFAWLLAPLLRRMSDDEVALWVERQAPELRHRLISAVQFNRPEARTEGMSADLIAAVTHQAVKQAGYVSPGQVCDGRRMRWAVWVTLPAVLLVAGLVYAAPATWKALAARQFLADVDIPRSVQLAATSPEVWEAGEDKLLEIRAKGKTHKDQTGSVLIEPEGGPSFRLALDYYRDAEDGAVFTARVPAADLPFRYHAWLGDGRLRKPGEVRYEARPVVQSIQAWVQLPESVVGRKANGGPYEEPQRSGDVVYRLAGSRLRLAAGGQMPLVSGELLLRGKRTAGGKEVEVEERLPLVRNGDALVLEKPLALPGEGSPVRYAGYELSVRNEFGFENLERPRRSIRRLPLEPPDVVLLPETSYRTGDSGTPEDYETEGIPVAEGSQFRLDYRCSSRYGLSHARVRYRVIPRSVNPEADSGRLDREAFLPLPLGPARGQKGPGSKEARLEFSTDPQTNPDAVPDTEGGGGYDFRINGIPDGKGGLLKLVEGDRIQFYVEVYSKADPDGTPGRSAIREKEVVTPKQLTNWLMKKDDLKERTRLLEEQQRNVRPGVEGP